jgi:hypothetical protein
LLSFSTWGSIGDPRSTGEFDMRIAALALGLVVAAGACASSGTAAGDQTRTASSTTRRTNVITAQEISESRAPTIGDMIRQTRPQWPRSACTAPNQGNCYVIFLNNDPDPSGTALNRALGTVREVLFLTKSEAQTKWGSRVSDMVIQIMSR